MPNTLALDEQAVDTALVGPCKPAYWRTKSATENIVGMAIAVAGRERTADRVALAISQFGTQNSRRATAQKIANAFLAAAQRGGLHAVHEAVLLQRELGESVIATIKLFQIGAQYHGFQAIDFAQPCRRVNSIPALGLQVAVPGAQCAQCFCRSASQCGGNCECIY